MGRAAGPDEHRNAFAVTCRTSGDSAMGNARLRLTFVIEEVHHKIVCIFQGEGGCPRRIQVPIDDDPAERKAAASAGRVSMASSSHSASSQATRAAASTSIMLEKQELRSASLTLAYDTNMAALGARCRRAQQQDAIMPRTDRGMNDCAVSVRMVFGGPAPAKSK